MEKLKNIEKILLYINVLIMLFMAGCIYITTDNIIKSDRATEFLNSVSTLVFDSTTLLILIIICCVICIVMNKLDTQEVKYKNIFLIIETIGILYMVALLGFNYNGIVLYIFVKVISMHSKARTKRVLLAVCIVLYIVTYKNLISFYRRDFIFLDYVNFYYAMQRQILIVLDAILKSINIVIFVLYCATYIGQQQQRIYEINTLYKELNDANQQLQAMNVKLVAYADEREHYGQINERNRVAREIHDTLGHMFTGLSYGMQAAIDMVEKSVPKTKEQLNNLLEITKKGMSEARRSVKALMPEESFEDKLKDKLEELIVGSKRLAPINIEYEIDIKRSSFKEDEALTIYRIVQESITNCFRHSKAKNLLILVREVNNNMYINIKDDGVGFKEKKSGFGIAHIKERVRLLNGNVEYKDENGFEVEVNIPLRWEKIHDKSSNCR